MLKYFVLITGNDSQINFPVEIVTLGEKSVTADKIKGYNVKNIKSSEYKGEKLDKIIDVKIVYNPSDVYTAKLLAKQIGGGVKLIADNEINGKIIIVSKN